MAVVIVSSAEAGAGRSLIAAAIAYRLAREGRAVTLARLAGDDGAEADARTLAAIDGLVSPGAPMNEQDLTALALTARTNEVVLEAPPGDASSVADRLDARVLVVTRDQATAGDRGPRVAGAVVTRAPAAAVGRIREAEGVLAVLPEDRVLAAPSAADIARALNGRWLFEAGEGGSVNRVMIGTVSSDAATPYFGARERKCVITRFDKTDIQLAALQTDTELLVLTGGGEPSPYLIDRVAGYRDDISVLLVDDGTVDVMRAVEGLYGGSRFDGRGKLLRAVELLDAAHLPLELLGTTAAANH